MYFSVNNSDYGSCHGTMPLLHNRQPQKYTFFSTHAKIAPESPRRLTCVPHPPNSKMNKRGRFFFIHFFR